MPWTRSAQSFQFVSVSRMFIGVAAFLSVTLPAWAQAVSAPNGANAPRTDSMAVLTPVVVTVNVIDKLGNSDLLWPDPSQRVVVRDEALEANPGRPGVPVSIPGLPSETASGGIKAPQYFAPGVAGDHGEPIAQYLQVGSYLVPNNLSANAHGNGYSDPNIFIPETIESVHVDAGAFNVREGNHAVDLATTYSLRDHTDPFLTVAGDYRDIDVMAGWSPRDPATRFLIAAEGALGNGLLDFPEHRQQYKFTTLRQITFGRHTLALAALAYYGGSRIPGLVPLGVPGLGDTIDPRQRDRTQSSELVFNDLWQVRPDQAIQLSGFFRTYDLSLLSNFGDGLIRQKEFRTVSGASAAYTRDIRKYLKIFAGLDFNRDAPRGVELDHYLNATDFSYYGPFRTVTSNNLTFGSWTPYVAAGGSIARYLTYTVAWRHDVIDIQNEDLLRPMNSFQKEVAVDSPKATLTILPPSTLLPTIGVSFGQSFYTNDPRIGLAGSAGTLVNRSHAYQVVISKLVGRTDLRLTLSRVTSEQSLAKIDADTGLQQYEGPSRNRVATLAVRRYFSFGLLQGSIAKADARDLETGLPVPEAPRLIFDALGTVDKLPLKLHFRGEVEYVGQKPLGDGFVGVPVKEFRGALARSFYAGRLDTGANFLLARGYSGQTLETLSTPDDTQAFERVVGVRLHSYISVSLTYHFRRAK